MKNRKRLHTVRTLEFDHHSAAFEYILLLNLPQRFLAQRNSRERVVVSLLALRRVDCRCEEVFVSGSICCAEAQRVGTSTVLTARVDTQVLGN
jgi:hypothetical protein